MKLKQTNHLILDARLETLSSNRVENIPRVVCEAPRLVLASSIVRRITAIVVASHQFNGIEAVLMRRSRIQRQVPRLARQSAFCDGDSASVIGAIIFIARMLPDQLV